MIADSKQPAADVDLEKHHPSQTNSLGDKLILVDAADQELGVLDKKTCHLNSYNRNGGKPHRAFSLFMFNHNNQLLLHRRSNLKIAFPNAWTNSVCSHPAVNELGEGKYEFEAPAKAVVRRTLFELGADISTFQLYHVDKILYRSEYDETWGEHELDHVFVCKVDQALQDTIKPNPEQISKVHWVSRDKLQSFMDETIKEGGCFSPWFSKIHQTKLLQWWTALETKGEASLANVEIPPTNEYL